MKIPRGIALAGFVATLIGVLGCTNSAADIRCGGAGGEGGGGSGGCGSDALPAVEIDRWHGDQQTGVVCTTLAESLVVHVLLIYPGKLDGGATVYWSTADKGGKLSPAISITDSLGFASTQWTLGCVAGGQSAYAVTIAATDPIGFTATAVAALDSTSHQSDRLHVVAPKSR